MPLTQAQMEKPVLDPKARALLARKPLRAIMQLNQWERAEVLAFLESSGALIWMKANCPEDVTFTIESQVAWEPTQKYTIPGGDQDPRPFPYQVGAHVLRNLDQPQFGGRSQQQGPYVPGEPREIQSVPEDLGRISFWTQLPGDPPPTQPTLELPASARKRAAKPDGDGGAE